MLKQSEESMQLMTVSNGGMTVGVDLDRGGAVSWLSHATLHPDNCVNTWDCGRLVQQSYYGEKDGSSWNGAPWVWNAVQGGAWRGEPGKVLSCNAISPSRLTVRANPRHWATGALLEGVVMDSDVSISDDGSVHIVCGVTSDAAHASSTQELPALFLSADFTELRYRLITDPPGTLPRLAAMVTTADPLRTKLQLKKNGGTVDYTTLMFVDPVAHVGMQLQSPSATGATAYRVFSATNPPASNCSYVAPTAVFALAPAGVHRTYEFTLRLVKV